MATSAQGTDTLRCHLAALQRRNTLLRKLRAMQQAPDSVDGCGANRVDIALTAARESGDVTTDVLEQIVNASEHLTPSKSGPPQDYPRASRTVPHVPPLRLRCLGENDEGGGRATGSHTARELGANESQRACSTEEPLENSVRYRTLLVALNLATPSPNSANVTSCEKATAVTQTERIIAVDSTTQNQHNGGVLDGRAGMANKNTARRARTREGVPLVRRKLDFEEQKQTSAANSETDIPSTWLRKAPRKERPATTQRNTKARSAPVQRDMARPRTKSLPVTAAEITSVWPCEVENTLLAHRLSLPSSPRWTDDMNPGQQPDGEFSKEMMKVFSRGVRSLLRPLRFGGTALQVKVEAKRSKHATQMWAAVRAEEASDKRQPAGKCTTSRHQWTQQGGGTHRRKGSHSRVCSRIGQVA